MLEKGLGFSVTPSSINEVDFRRHICNFSRNIRCKWFFRNESQENAGETSEFKVSPQGAPTLELFLSQA